MKSNEAKIEFEDIKKTFFPIFKIIISATDSQYPKTHTHQILAPKNNLVERYSILQLAFSLIYQKIMSTQITPFNKTTFSEIF